MISCLLGKTQPPTQPLSLSWVSSFLSGASKGSEKEAGSGSKTGDSITPPLLNDSAAVVPDMCASIPRKLVERILALDFVDMADLLPEQWRIEENREGSCCGLRRPTKKALLTDILVWLECFSTMVAVLASKYPEKTVHFMAYQQTIIHASKNFSGTAWATYDLCFRRKAANLRSLDWGVIDQGLYSKSFTGRAKSTVRCRYCLSDAHSSDECVDSPRDTGKRDWSTSREVCLLFNKPGGNVCRYSPCRFEHICSRCRRGSHPAAECRGQARDRSPVGRRETGRGPKK